VGAEISVRSCHLQVFVYQATEAVSSEGPNGRYAGRGSALYGRPLM